MSEPLPEDFGLELDPSARRTDDGRVLIGGTPLRILRLTEAGGRVVDDLSHGGAVGPSDARQRLARRLLDRGLAQPRPGARPFGVRDVTVVVPMYGDPDGLDRTLVALRADTPAIRIIVVDDATPGDGSRIADVVAARGAELVRRTTNGGPAAARNRGLTEVATPVVAFVDRDAEPDAGWLEPLLGHFADPTVAAVAPRIRPTPGSGARHAFEQTRSPLDLGPAEARVGPGSRVSYVPSTVLVARRAALEPAPYDERMRVGEDVDLVWRLVAANATVRYEPRSVVHHPTRPTMRAWIEQRFAYGCSAAPLDGRHPGALAPLSLSGWTVGAWGLVAAGHPVAGVGLGAGAMALLPAKLEGLEHPWPEALRLAGGGQLQAWRPIATALTRTWWPATALGAVVSGRVRRAALAAIIVPAALEWLQGDRQLDPVRFTALRVLDDVAYGAGVWAGCVRERRFGPLRPVISSWPGRRPAIEPAAPRDPQSR